MKSTKYYLAASVLVGLLASPSTQGTTLSGGSFFRGDASGNNLNGGSGILFYGGWTTVLNQQNIPGNYGYNLFLAQTATPAPADFLSPSAALSVPLSVGANTFYFWADKDDLNGGSSTFGLNLFFNGAGPLSPALSGYVVPGVGQTLLPNTSPNTSGLNFQYIPGTGALSFIDGSQLITLTSFEVTGVGGGVGGVDLVNSDNTIPFVGPPHANGVNDTYGRLTLTVFSIPEPGSFALVPIGALGILARRRRSMVR